MRPRVLVNMASSLDGKINPARRSGPFVMSRHPVDPERMLVVRALADAILIGSGNLRADNPDLAISDAARSERGGAPLRVVITTQGDGIRGDERFFDPTLGGPSIVMHAESMSEATRQRLSARAELVCLGEVAVEITRALEWLSRRCKTVLSEGGGVLNAALFAARAVDELYLTVVPRVLGGISAPTAVAGSGFAPDEIPDATLLRAETIGDELFLHYRFDWPK